MKYPKQRILYPSTMRGDWGSLNRLRRILPEMCDLAEFRQVSNIGKFIYDLENVWLTKRWAPTCDYRRFEFSAKLSQGFIATINSARCRDAQELINTCFIWNNSLFLGELYRQLSYLASSSIHDGQLIQAVRLDFK